MDDIDKLKHIDDMLTDAASDGRYLVITGGQMIQAKFIDFKDINLGDGIVYKSCDLYSAIKKSYDWWKNDDNSTEEH